MIFPKSDRLVLFGAMKGRWYGDNGRHLYEWVLKNHSNLRPVWLTSDQSIARTLRDENKPVVLQRSMRGVRLIAQARVATFTNSLADLAAQQDLIPDSIKLIALRHGRSVKRIRFARREHKISDKAAKSRRHEGDMIRYAISTSDFISDLQEECLRIGRQKHVVTGYPRNDVLFNIPEEARTAWRMFVGGTQPRKVVLYGPSWRHDREATKFFPFRDFCQDTLIDFLEETRTLLLLRPHVQDLHYSTVRSFLQSLVDCSDMVKSATHEQFHDVNLLIPFVDILISDYSALYHDFLLLDRPMIFIPYDYAVMKRLNGFLYDYYANLPGPSISSFEEFMSHFGDIVSGKDAFRERRRKLRDKIHTYQDSNSCSRVADLIDRILNGED